MLTAPGSHKPQALAGLGSLSAHELPDFLGGQERSVA
jgi:hypothetical protein